MAWLFATRFRRWLLLVLGVPLLVRLLRGFAGVYESRRGPGAVPRTLHTGADALEKLRGGRRRRRGLLRRTLSR